MILRIDGQDPAPPEGRVPGRRDERGAFEHHVRRIRSAAQRELARRRASTGVRGMIARWRWPILAVASLMGLLALVALREHPAAAQRSLDLAVERSLGIPAAHDAWQWTTTAPEETEPTTPDGQHR